MTLRLIGIRLAGILALAATLVPYRSEAAEPVVVVTVKPVHALVAAVMQGAGAPRLLIEDTGSPHTFTLKPSDAKAVNAARLFVRVGEGLEPFTAKLVAALPRTVRVVTLEQVNGLTLHAMRAGGTFEADAHDAKAAGGHAGHAHGHAAKPAARVNDGHIWLDPVNAKLIAAHIADVLAEIAPSEAGRFRANAAEMANRLDKLDGELKAALAPFAGRSYLVFHDAYQYLERRYGLTPAGSVTVSPDVPPSGKRLTELRRKVGELKAACVFAEPQFAPKVIEAIIEGSRARRGTLDPLGAAIPAGAEQYFTMMRALATDLRSCLADPA